jgi:quercetin dioxygenase-like cupin family protein
LLKLTAERTLPLPLLLALLLAPTAAQDAAIVNPKIVKVEFENGQVRILRMRYEPHERLDMHSHPAKAEIQLTDGSVRIITPDGKSRDDPGSAGEFFWLEPTKHAVENLENAPLEIIEIELKKAVAPSVSVSAPSPKGNPVAGEPLPLQEEPHHRWKFENQYVRVFDVVLTPGESTLFHTHSYSKGIDVQLNEATVQDQAPGKEWEPVSKVFPGEVSYGEDAKVPYTHRVSNVGTTAFHLIYVELLQ